MAALIAAVQAQLDAYDVGSDQRLVYRWPVQHRNGGEVTLGVMIDMPSRCIRVGFADDFAWETIEQHGFQLTTGKASRGFNSQMRQLRNPN